MPLVVFMSSGDSCARSQLGAVSSPWALVQTSEGGSSSQAQRHLINICYASVLTGEASGFICLSLVIVSCPALQATQRPLLPSLCEGCGLGQSCPPLPSQLGEGVLGPSPGHHPLDAVQPFLSIPSSLEFQGPTRIWSPSEEGQG